MTGGPLMGQAEVGDDIDTPSRVETLSIGSGPTEDSHVWFVYPFGEPDEPDFV